MQAPTAIRQGQRATVTARLVRADFAGDVAAGLREEGFNVTVEDVPRVGPRMRARLDGRGNFEVSPVGGDGSDTQLVPSTGQEWKWDVWPKRAGRHELALTLSVVLNVDGLEGQSSDVEVKYVPITVRVDPVYTTRRVVSSLWPQYILGPGSVAGALLALVGWTRRRRRPSPPPPIDDGRGSGYL